MSVSSIKISVVIPIFNAHRHLSGCLRSIIRQTLREIEIVCVDDASTDDSVKILERYAQSDDRIKIIRNKKNLSANVARKRGAHAAVGEYILFVDPDDFLEDNALERLYSVAKASGADVVHFGTDIINCGVTAQQMAWYTEFVKPYCGLLEGEEVFEKCFVTQEYRFNIWNKLIRASLCKYAMRYCVDAFLPKAQDLYAWFLIAYFAQSYYGISDRLYHYRYGGGISGRHIFSEVTFAVNCMQADVAYYIVNFLLQLNKFEKYFEVVDKIIENLINENYRALCACIQKKSHFDAKKIFYSAWAYGLLQMNLLNRIHKTFDSCCAKLLFRLNIKLYQIADPFTKEKLINNFECLFDKYGNKIDSWVERFELQSSGRLYGNIIASLQKSKVCGKMYIPIFFAANDFYAPYLSVALNSLLKNRDKRRFYDIFILHSGICTRYAKKLNGIAGERYAVHCINICSAVQIPFLYPYKHCSREMYFRIFIPELFWFLPKVLYLDCDIILRDSIHRLFDFPLEGKTLGAAHNFLHEAMCDYVTNTLRSIPAGYFNSGVLLIDTQLFLRQNIKIKFLRYLNEHRALKCPDQDALNIVCPDVAMFDCKWNFQWHHVFSSGNPRQRLMPQDAEVFEQARKDIRLLHFTSGKKPWLVQDGELAPLFWRYVHGSALEKEFSCADERAETERESAVSLAEEAENCRKSFIFRWFGAVKRLYRAYKRHGAKYVFMRLFCGKNCASKYLGEKYIEKLEQEWR